MSADPQASVQGTLRRYKGNDLEIINQGKSPAFIIFMMLPHIHVVRGGNRCFIPSYGRYCTAMHRILQANKNQRKNTGNGKDTNTLAAVEAI